MFRGEINEILNHPEVFPHISEGLPWPLDIRNLEQRDDILFLMTPLGGFIMRETAPGVLEAHVAFLPEGRGKHAIVCARVAIRACFDSGFRRIEGSVALENRAARLYCRLIGMHSAGISDGREHFIIERIH